MNLHQNRTWPSEKFYTMVNGVSINSITVKPCPEVAKIIGYVLREPIGYIPPPFIAVIPKDFIQIIDELHSAGYRLKMPEKELEQITEEAAFKLG